MSPTEQVTVGLDSAVATMVKGELAKVTVKFEYGFGHTEVKRQLTTVPPCSTLIYEVELMNFTKVWLVQLEFIFSIFLVFSATYCALWVLVLQEKESWEMSAHEKLEAAEKSKVAGNDLFKIGKFQRAAKKYNKVLEVFPSCTFVSIVFREADWFFILRPLVILMRMDISKMKMKG